MEVRFLLAAELSWCTMVIDKHEGREVKTRVHLVLEPDGLV